MIDWNDLDHPSDRRGLCVLEGQLGADVLNWMIKRVKADDSLDDGEKARDLALSLELAWDGYLDELGARHGANGLHRLEVGQGPNWVRVASYLLDVCEPLPRRQPAPLLEVGATIARWLGRKW